MLWDAEVRRYETLQELNAYAARVAGTVGAMMTLVMGQRSPEIVARPVISASPCSSPTSPAMSARTRAPAGCICRFSGCAKPASIRMHGWQNRSSSRRSPRSCQRLLDSADALYDRATLGIAHLPLACRPGIYAARALYAEIGRELERNGLDSISRRAVVSANRKLDGTRADADPAGNGMGAGPANSGRRRQLDETRFLVEAVAATPLRAQSPKPRSRPIEDRVVWVIDLFARLERRDQLQRTGSFR